MLTQLVCVWTVKKVYLKNYKKAWQTFRFYCKTSDTGLDLDLKHKKEPGDSLLHFRTGLKFNTT